MQFFVFNNADNKLEIDEFSILLIKEFNDLWDINRNKCKEDKTGKQRLKAYKELTYIYLDLDFKSPYFQYKERDKHEAALADSGLTEKDITDPVFLAAFRKYKEIQESDPILSLIKTAYNTLFKLQIFLDNIDFQNDVDAEGRLLYKPKEIMDSITSIANMRNKLKELEAMHKNDLAADGKNIRGDYEPGFLDG